MKRGITIITLSVMILVIIIIATTVTITGANAINNSKKMKFASELLFMKETVENYKSLNTDRLPIKDTAITSTELPEGNYYEIDIELLGNIDTTYGRKLNGDSNDIYVYSKENNQIYYLKGVKIGNTTYYYLNDELKEVINYEGERINGKDGITFTSSNTNFTNEAIKVIVKVPNTYTNVSVTSQDTSISNFNNLNGYYVYEISKSSNYDIVVNYTKDDKASKQVYTVSNFDNEAPTIDVINEKIISSNNETKNSITISTSDNLSGVRKVMYEVDNVDKNYFENNKKGIIVTNNNITLEKYINNITFYIIDNAGNSAIVHKQLKTTTSTDDYIKYGLMIHYDGINNTGNGHSSTATTWKDLSGHGKDGILNGCEWNDNYLNLTRENKDFVNMGVQNYENITLEVVILHDTLLGGETDYIGNFEGCGYGITYNSSNTKNNEMWIYDKNSESYQKIVAENNVIANKIYSLSGSYDGNILKLFENNTKYSLNIKGRIKLFPYMILALGMNPKADGTASGAFFNGRIYSVRVYNRALTDEEVKHNYNIDKARFGF